MTYTRALALAAIALLGAARELGAQADGLVAFPETYRVQFENEYVRLVRVRVAGGAALGMHSHPAGFMFHVYLNDAEPLMFSHDGPPHEITRPAVTARSYRIGNATPEVHAVLNLSATHTDFQRVEYKTRGTEYARQRVPAPPLGTASSTVVEHTGVQSRVTRVTIAAGDSTEFVTPAAQASLLIIVTDGVVAEGSVTAGAERFVAPGSKSVIRNAGTTPIQVLRFDFLTPPAQ